jgi:glycine/D-amino acid oxidase-like deaminating enzyme
LVPDVIVIGAGVVGTATAHALAEAGARVEVLEAGQVAGGTSAATFAVDITPVKTPRLLFDLAVRSVLEHEALEPTLSSGPWRHRAAWLQWERPGPDRRRLRERVQRLQAWGYPAEWVSRDRAPQLDPALKLPVGDANEIAVYRDGAWYEPPVLARALLEDARAHGAAVHVRDPVTATKATRGRIVEVTTAAGRRVSADVVVNCAGPRSADVAALAGVSLPLCRVPGLVVTTTPASCGLRTIVAAADLNLRPHTGDRIVLHSWRVDAELAAEPPWRNAAALAPRLLDRARVLLPGLGNAAVQSACVGVRPIPPDGLPVVGLLPGLENLYVVVAHSAAHLAPVLGRLAADELTGISRAQLEPFRPARLRLADDGRPAEDESTRTMLAQIIANTTQEHIDAD